MPTLREMIRTSGRRTAPITGEQLVEILRAPREARHERHRAVMDATRRPTTVRVGSEDRLYLTPAHLTRLREEVAGRLPRKLTFDPNRRVTAARAAASPAVPAALTPKEALGALQGMVDEIRREGGVSTNARAFAIACDRRPDLASAANLEGAGSATLDAWVGGVGRSHAAGCVCAGNGTCAGWAPQR